MKLCGEPENFPSLKNETIFNLGSSVVEKYFLRRRNSASFYENSLKSKAARMKFTSWRHEDELRNVSANIPEKIVYVNKVFQLMRRLVNGWGFSLFPFQRIKFSHPFSALIDGKTLQSGFVCCQLWRKKSIRWLISYRLSDNERRGRDWGKTKTIINKRRSRRRKSWRTWWESLMSSIVTAGSKLFHPR